MASSWIFQGNPKRFNIDGFLAGNPVETEWLVSRYFDQIEIGDQVYLWRSAGTGAQPAGVVAEARVISDVREVADPESKKFWLGKVEDAPRPRVRIEFTRIANKREVIKRDWWMEDPILSDHLIMKMANHTTYKIEGDHLRRLEVLWAKTGTDWPYEDVVGGLYAFAKTRGGPVSRSVGSEVATVAKVIGRPIAGIYNKVMNFRSLDPEDSRAGLSGASDMDRYVWSQFYSAGTLRVSEIEAEYERVWYETANAVDADAARKKYQRQVEELEKGADLASLLAAYAKRREGKQKKPGVRRGSVKMYERDPLVGAIARARANFTCEAPECSIELFTAEDGMPYVEVHHIHTLATGGLDTPENTCCLCPMHHREAHHGKDAEGLTNELRQLRDS